jgi:nucleoside diphosphate kinase
MTMLKKINKNQYGTCVLLKPDCCSKIELRYAIEALLRTYCNEKNYTIVKEKVFSPTRTLMEELYIEHKEEKWFEEFIDFMTIDYLGTDCRVFLIIDNDSIICNRESNIIPDIKEFVKYIRKASCAGKIDNRIHSSDSPEAAIREYRVLFKPLVKKTVEGEISK